MYNKSDKFIFRKIPSTFKSMTLVLVSLSLSLHRMVSLFSQGTESSQTESQGLCSTSTISSSSQGGGVAQDVSSTEKHHATVPWIAQNPIAFIIHFWMMNLNAKNYKHMLQHILQRPYVYYASHILTKQKIP